MQSDEIGQHMPEANVNSQNITLVYDTFTQDDIDSRLIKRLFPDPVIVNDFPELSIFVWPQEKLLIQIGDRRFRVTKQESGNAPYNLWEPTQKANQIINKIPIAMGCNFDLTVQCDKSPAEIMRSLFNHDMEKISAALDGPLLDFTPRFKIQKGRFTYDFILDVVETKNLPFIFHVNAHLEKPTPEDITHLEILFTAEFQRVKEMTQHFVMMGC